MEELKRERSTAKRRFNRKVGLFEDAHRRGDSTETLQVLYDEVCECFRHADVVNEKMIDLLEIGESCQEYEDYIRELEAIKCSLIDILKGKLNEKPKSALAMKKLEPPKFSGSVRAFPSFVRDYERLVVSQHGEDPYVLRISLEGEPRRLVEDLDDYKRMWKRLNETYGNEGKLIDAILGDMRSYKPLNDGDDRRLINLINTVEKVWLDVSNLGLTNEIENVTVLTQVERLLPLMLKREWAIKVQDMKTDKFKNLVRFLTDHRKALEYLQNDSRSAVTKVAVHTVGKESEKECDLLEAIRLLSKGQEKLQNQMSECLTNLSQVTDGKYQGRTYITKFNNVSKERKYCIVHDVDSHELQDCMTFKQWTAENQLDFLKQKGICYACLKRGHLSRDCIKKLACRVKVNGDICGKHHHYILHPIFTNTYSTIDVTSNHLSKKGAFLMTGFVDSGGIAVPTLYDAGSNISLITFRMAKKLGLKGNPIQLSLTKVGGHTEELDSLIYEISLRDGTGKEEIVEVCGISEITVVHHQVDLSEIAKKLEVQEKDIQRPEGSIELLIGSDHCTLIPQVIKTVDNVQLMSNMFGLCIRGRLDDKGDEKRYQVQINHISCNNTTDWHFQTKPNVGKLVENYFSDENLGTECIPKCGGCKCGECSIKGNLTIKEEREMKLIEEGLIYDKQNHCWVSNYPWISDPSKLPNNYPMAFARLKATEQRLKKMGPAQCAKYQEQIQDMLDRGVAEKLSKEEMLNYKGPTFYLPHHEVYKADSISTPIRLVFNAAASYQGVSLNDLLAKGPDIMNNLVGILLRFREEEVGMVGDIKKMYNAVKLSEDDMHTHRFLWRNFNLNREPIHYKLKTVTFGDKPSGSIAMLALRKTAEMNVDFPLASKIITEDSYVDDIISSISSKDCAIERIKEIEEVLKPGGFEIKYWVLSGEGDENNSKVLITEKEKVLGLGWKPKHDDFSFKVKLNFSKRTREGRAESDMTCADFESRMPRLLTKRSVLSQFATLYDPLGLLTPFTLKTKLMMRSIIMEVDKGNSVGWDEPISETLYSETIELFREMFEVEKLSFRRCVMPADVITNPELIIFCDSSMKAYGAVAYIRWEKKDGTYHVNLLCSKNRITPMRQISIPRLELCAAVLASRLRVTIEREMRYQFSKVIHITDSEIVRAQIQKESHRFNTFVGNRIAEIQSKTEPIEWFWVSSKENNADLTTRECSPLELGTESIWQKGPEFLYQDFSQWPVKQNTVSELPDLVFARIALNAEITTCNQLIDIQRFSNMKRLLSVMSRVMNVVRKRSFRAILHDPTTEDIQRSELYFVKNAQASLPLDWEKRYKRLGPRLREDGIITVGSRMSKWLKDNWNCNQFILLPPKHPFSELYLSHIHQEIHGGVESSLARAQVKYWILGARKTMKSIRKHCVVCRKIDKIRTSQCMGELPKERLEPCPPWYNVSIDFFGPFWVCDTVKRRVKRKIFAVIFNCMVTRAVHLDISEGYDTQNFLTVLKRFTCLRGFPKKLYSDNGTQLVSANKELREMVTQWNKHEVFNFGKFKGLTWVFNRAADAPWENSCSESLIRLVKRSLSIIIGESVVSFGELQSIMYEVANILNERPIGFKPGEDFDDGTVLRPNDLLLGRSTIEAPCGFWDESRNLNKSHAFKIKVIDLFWKKWMKNYFPTLIVRQKWHVSVRNVQKGDIVLVNDQNVLKGEWRLAQVVESIQGRDGKTRDVLLRYKINESGKRYIGQRDVQITRSVHRLVVILPVEEQEK